MSESSPLVKVHVNIELSAASLQAVVANSKMKAGPDEKGRYRVDTADALAALISTFPASISSVDSRLRSRLPSKALLK